VLQLPVTETDAF